MNVPSNIVHKKLYIQAKQKADATYKRHSAYKSMFIVSTYKKCKRVNKSTPITLPELIKLHSKKNLLSLARKKNKDMNGRVYWKTLRFISSKK